MSTMVKNATFGYFDTNNTSDIPPTIINTTLIIIIFISPDMEFVVPVIEKI